MGAAHQKLGQGDSPVASSSHSQDIGDVDVDATPPRGQGWPKRQLPFDPRSPTDNIDRTPIIVDKTPDNILDPRSPTPGVERTPLTLSLGRGTGDAGVPMETVDNIADAQDTEIPSPQNEACSPDSGCSMHDMMVDVDDSSPLIQSSEDQRANFGTFGDARPHTRSVPNPKQLFPSIRRSNLIQDIPVTRSPLSAVTVDTNSPRQIVQAKQRKLVARSGSGFRGLTNEQFVDKENLSH